MKKQGRRILSLILSFTMVVAGLNYFAYATETDMVEADLRFACEGYAEPQLGEDVPSELQLASADGKADLSQAAATVQWIKKENAAWVRTDEEQFGEGEYRLAVGMEDVTWAGEYELPADSPAVSVNGETFEYPEDEGLESTWQVAENKASFTVYSKVYKLNGVEYWKNIFTQAGAYEYAAALDLETAIDYNKDPEFAGKTDEERIQVVKGWLAAAEEEEPVVLADPPIYYQITTETDDDGNSIQVLHLGNAPYDPANPQVYTNSLFSNAEQEAINKIVIDNPIVGPSGVNSGLNFFRGFKNVTSIEGLNKLDTSNMVTMDFMFYNCYKLESIDLSGFDTGNVTSMSNMFAGCMALQSLDVSGFNTQKVIDMGGMFKLCEELRQIIGLDSANFSTENVTNMSYMFMGCGKLKSLDLSGFETSSVTDMQGMFLSCDNLRTLDLSNFNTENVTNMMKILDWCSRLTKLDISSFVINEGVSVSGFFDNDTCLKELRIPASIDANIKIPLPQIMIDTPGRTQVYEYLPTAGPITLIAYDMDLMENLSESTLLFKKYLDGVLTNDIGRFEFGVFKEDGTDTGIRVENEAIGTIQVETENLPLGRYYVQEMVGTDSNMYYDTAKYYFTIEEETISTQIIYETTDLVYISYGQNYLDPKKYDLVANGLTVTVYDKNTGAPIKTLKAYCADKTKRAPTGSLSSIPNYIYYNPIEDEINWARGKPFYEGPHKGNLPAVIEYILFSMDGDNGQKYVQDQIWNLLNFGEEIDVPEDFEKPEGFNWAIIQNENKGFQPLIVPLFVAEDRDVYEAQEENTITRRTVKLEVPDIEFRNVTNPDNGVLVQLPVKKTIDGGETPIGANRFKFRLTGNGENVTVENNSNGDIFFPPMTFTEPGTYTYTIEEIVAQGDWRDGVLFNFDHNPKTVTVTVSAHDLQPYDPTANYFAFKKHGYDDYYYVDTTPGGEGIIMYCTNEDLIGPAYDTAVAPASQTYSAIINPTITEIKNNGLVHLDDSGNVNDEANLIENLKKLFYYFETAEGSQIPNNDKQALVWTLTDGETRTINSIGVNGETASTDVQTVLNNIYSTVSIPSLYNLAFFVPTGAQVAGHPQPLATGYGAVMDVTANGVVFNNTTVVVSQLELTANKSFEGGTLAADQFSFQLKDENGNVLQTKKNDANGAVTFDPIKYTVLDKGQTFTYTVSEVNDGAAGIDYDNTIYTVTASVGYNGNLRTIITKPVEGEEEPEYVQNMSFTNTLATPSLELSATKTLTGATLAAGQFRFQLIDANGRVLQTKRNDADGIVTFDTIDYTAEDFGETYTYSVIERNDGQAGMTYDTTVYTVTVAIDEQGNLTQTITKPGENGTEPQEVQAITFANTMATPSLELSATKTLTGATLAADQFSFQLIQLVDENENVLQTKKNDADGLVTFDGINYGPSDFGQMYMYKVKEVTGTEAGIQYDAAQYIVLATISDQGVLTTRVFKATDGAGLPTLPDAINFTNSAIGNLVITKTIEGDVTPEEAAGAISFTVTGPDNFNETYTLADFTESNGVYTLTLNDVHVGQYTVEETTHDIDGTTVTVTYTVNGGQETEGDSTTAEVTNGGTATVAFNNNYSENVGNLVITKTIEGDVTAEEVAGAISFTVTGPDNFNETYTLADFTESNGVYTLTLNDVHVGQYTVEETTHDIDGTTVTVTYTVNGGQETEGDSTTAEVTNGGTATVAFNNNYSENVGNLVITKTIEGDVTAEEAAGAISFTVTGPDNFNETYTLADFTESNGVYTLTLNDVHVGQYTVEETTHDIDGKTVTVTYTVNGGQEATGDVATAEVTNGGTATVAFNNNYSENVGNLVITKTIEGDVTPEEAAGAISFTVTGPDNFNETYTLADFTESNGVYTLTLNDVKVGEYTVEETTHDIDGTTVTVTYTVNGGQETEGDSTTAEVTNGGTATVAFNNNYSENVGNLVITKTIEGDVTPEEAAGAISFTVTGPDNFNETYTLADFTESNGVYTLTLNDVKVGQYTVEETTHDIDGKNVTVTYKVNAGEEKTGDKATGEVTEGNTTTVDFNNSYENKKGNLEITKTIEGDVTAEEAAGAISFTVTGPDNFNETYTLADFTESNGVYTLTLNDVKVGQYTVEETTHDIDGKNVTVTYKVNAGEEKTGDKATGEVTEGNTTTVDFNNSYENKKGNLEITKTIEGDVTAEEAEGAITFKVTGPDGTSKTYTLADFTKNEDGTYTLKLNDVEIGQYTVEETTKDVDGKNVTVTYKVNAGEEKTGDKATGEVTEGNTTTVDFNNSYENKKGNLEITKTIEGDVTAEEAEGAITFKVTGPDGTSKTYTLADFTKNEDGTYTLKLNDVEIGQYTVEETTKDVDGKNVTVTYKVNAGEEKTGDKAAGEVTEGNTTTVEFKNSYENKKGNIEIIKTIEGDVTAEEAEGAITFKVTGPGNFDKTYTLADFTKNEDGTYTLKLDNVVIGQYTVEETTKDVDGKNVTVTYTINNGEEKTGDKAAGEVTEGNTTTVEFKNSYENKKGNLEITKTIEGDVTAEEAEGAITFKVTAPNGTSKTYTLADFTKNEDGTYTLKLDNVVIGQYTVEETTKDVDGKNVTVTYTVNAGEEKTGDKATGEVTEGNTTTVEFKNSYENKKGNLEITKTIEGDVTEEEAEGAITFKVTGPNGTSKTYTLADFTKNEDGTYTLELNDVEIGQYTVEETTKDVDGKNVTVTYTVNAGEEKTGDKATGEVTEGNTTTVEFKNSYENKKGNLEIIKTIEGDVTAEEAEGAITFKVTGPDGTSKTYTLADFTKNEDGTYTLKLNDVEIGQYTVEETTKDVDGKNVTVTYTVNAGEEKTGDKAAGEVTEGNTTTVEFKNSYENKKGNLEITKTIEGDVTEEEAEGAITFKVTAPDGTSKTYTLADFTKNEDGTYTLKLNDVEIGQYTVEETTKDVDGKNVTVTYTINNGEEKTGDKATGEVTEGKTTTVEFKNSYENKKGNLEITKTIEGDITAEEAEGTITFKVTGPDGTSKTYTLADFTKNEDGTYTLKLTDVEIGQYTVEETTKDVDGKTVTVKYTVNGGEATEGDKAGVTVEDGKTATVTFENTYADKPEEEKGNLEITKTIKGDITAEEAEGTITFKVTAPDGTSKTYTLADFTKNEDGTYTLKLTDVEIGQYTVEETTKDVDGKTVTVKYTVNSGEATEGDKAGVTVEDGKTATVTFENTYADKPEEEKPEEEKGNLEITKTIKGDITAEEAEGTITFKVTAPDGTSKTYTLADFTKNEDGTYTLKLTDVEIGQYTVEETTKDIDGKTVTVKYTVNSGEATEGDKTGVTVEDGKTATVTFENTYADKPEEEKPDDENPGEEKPDDEKPEEDTPGTGDGTPIMIWELLMLVSAAVLAATGYKIKKSK